MREETKKAMESIVNKENLYLGVTTSAHMRLQFGRQYDAPKIILSSDDNGRCILTILKINGRPDRFPVAALLPWGEQPRVDVELEWPGAIRIACDDGYGAVVEFTPPADGPAPPRARLLQANRQVWLIGSLGRFEIEENVKLMH